MVLTLCWLPAGTAGNIFSSVCINYVMMSLEYNKPEEKPAEMRTLADCINKAVLQGYTDSFKVTKQGMQSTGSEKFFKPEEVSVINFYRFEGESDPADNSILYVIETSDGLKGTLVDAYGPYADEAVNKFMKEVEDINKKVDKADDTNEPEKI